MAGAGVFASFSVTALDYRAWGPVDALDEFLGLVTDSCRVLDSVPGAGSVGAECWLSSGRLSWPCRQALFPIFVGVGNQAVVLTVKLQGGRTSSLQMRIFSYCWNGCFRPVGRTRLLLSRSEGRLLLTGQVRAADKQ